MPDYEPGIGFETFQKSGQRFPAWLSIGIELLDMENLPHNIDRDIDVSGWYAGAVSRGLPSLCDEWFIPGFIENDISAYAPSIAYAFVKHLSEINRLDDLAALYLQDETLWDAEYTRATLWANFAGGVPAIRETVFRYFFREIFDDIYIAGWELAPIAVTALTRQAIYYFSTGNWTRDNIAHYIEVSEEAITFVGDFLGYHHYAPLTIIVYVPPHTIREMDGHSFPVTGGRYLLEGAIVMFNIAEDGPLVIAHEVAHAIIDLNSMRHTSNFPMVEWAGSSLLEEGLCVVIDYMFYVQTKNDQFALMASEWTFGLNRRVTWDAAVTHIHRRAGWELDNDGLFSMRILEHQGYEDYMQKALASPYWQLQSYYTAASFILYLTEYRGTWDDFFRIYADIYLMEAVYGADMDGMIAQWLVYLEGRGLVRRW